MSETKKRMAFDRGKRLRLCRGYTRLNIKEFCGKYAFNDITFGRWERGVLPLSEKGAHKVCRALLSEEIACTPEWLLNGAGTPPSEVNGQALFQSTDVGLKLDVFPALLLFSEMEVFQRHNPNSLTYMVDNIAMASLYEIGDYVGGIKLEPSEYELAHKKTCIIKLRDSHKLLLRNVQFSRDKIVLLATNPKQPYSEPVVLEEKDLPEIIAPVILHRKGLEWVRKKL